jgi:hypothetical protein
LEAYARGRRTAARLVLRARIVLLAAQGKQDLEIAALLVKGDLDDEATLRRALAGVWGVFGVQNTGEAGVEREEAQGKRLATLAREAGVEHYVYTSVGSAHKRTGIPHFDNKWRIEDHRRQHGHRERHVTVGQQKYRCDDLKREDHPQVMRCVQCAHELSCNAPGGGRGMKFRKPLRPKTRKITPARYRAITEAVLITGFSFSIGAIT